MKTLRQVLAEHSEEQLEQLARWWGIGDTPAEQWRNHLGLLVQKMQDPVAARFVWEHLSEDERKLLHNALSFSASNGIMRGVLQTLTRLPQGRFEDALATLKDHLLILEEPLGVKGKKQVAPASAKSTAPETKQKPAFQPSTMLSIYKDIADSLSSAGRAIFSSNYDLSTLTLEKILAAQSMNDLYEIGRLYGITLNDYYSRVNPGVRLAGHLVQPEVSLYAWDQFDDQTRKLLKWLCEHGGQATMNEIRQHTGYDDPALAKIIHQLESYAIAFDTFSGAVRKLFIPREMLKHVQKAAAQTATIAQEKGPVGLLPLKEPPQSIHNGDTLVLYDLAFLIGAMYQQNIEPTKSGDVPKRIANKLLPQLQIRPRQGYDTSNFAADMLFSIAQKLGLVQLSASMGDDVKPHYEPGPQLAQWAQWDAAEQTHELLEYWLKAHNWADIAGVNFDPTLSSYYLDMRTGRSAVLKYLSQCTPGRWYSFDSLLRTMKAENPYLLRSNIASTGLPGYQYSKKILANWDRCDGEIIIGLLTSTLFELGLVSLGYEHGQPRGPSRQIDPATERPLNPDAFMLTDLAAAILPTEVEPPARAEDAAPRRTLIVQPNFELLLLEPDLPTLYRLLPFAQANQVGKVSKLTLTRSSLLRGLATTKTVEQVLRILEEHSQKEIPQNVAYTLRDWGKLYKEAAISQVLLLEVESEPLVNEILSLPGLKSLRLRRLGPCAIVADSGITFAELRRTLEKEGIVVHVNGQIITRRDYSTITYGRPR
ncbi:MAG TPA: helicase-associated domain-containing protein [Ktedonobacteraceae bacterium]|nr:helicase-associated domain-containing protein [Ktedonobacteraceae bacterium]